MKLEIIKGDFIDTIYGITLDEGRTPCLSSLSEKELSAFNIPDVEPALWFKTLVVTRVTLDCVRRHMTWATDKSCENSPRDNYVKTTESQNAHKRISGLIDSESSESSRTSGFIQTGLLRQGGKTKLDLKRLSESVFLHCSHADQSTDIEELFMGTEEVLAQYKNGAITKVRFYEEMFRILHCYILPAITFTTEDVPQLEAALEFQNALIERQDIKISSKDAETYNVNETMERQRENYACDIESSRSGLRLNYPRPLAVVLLNDFQEDLQVYSTQLAGAQADVNLLKAHICKLEERQSGSLHPKACLPKGCSISDECPELKLPETVEPDEMMFLNYSPSLPELYEEVKEKRLRRDKIFQKYKRTLHIREIMGEYVSDRVLLSATSNERVTKRKIIRSKLHLSGKVKVENPLHKIYMGLIEVKKEKTRETQTLVEQKVRLVSVKEGVRIALEELRTASTTYGIEFDHFGSLRSTDIMSRPQLPNTWQTLEEQVKQIVDDPKEPLCLAHTDGCEKILTECKLLLKFHNKYLESESDSDMQSGSPDTTSLLGSIANGGGNLHGSVNRDMRHRRASDSSSCFTSSDDFSDSSYGCSLHPESMYVNLHHIASQEPKQCARSRSSLVEFEQLEETSDDLVIIHDVSPDYARKAVEKLQKQIKAHMENMSRRLKVQVNRGVSLQKVWACYERIFFTVVNSDLKKIYKLAYMDVLHGLEEAVPKLTPFSLAMDNSIVYPLFYDKRLSSILPRNTTTTHAAVRGMDDGIEPVEDSVFVNSVKTNESILRETPVSENITRHRSDLTLVESAKKQNRETVILGANKTLDFHDLENSVNQDNDYSHDLNRPPVDGNRYSRFGKQGDFDLENEFDEFLEICTQDQVDQSKVIEGDRNSLPTKVGNIPQQKDVLPTSDGVLERDSLGSNFNIDLAESLISGTASGQLAKEMVTQVSVSSASSVDRKSLYGRSKYANVLDQINMDYARNVQRNVHICYPVSVNVNPPDRNTWPLAAKQEDLEVGQDVLSSMSGQEDLTNLEDSNPGTPRAGSGYVPDTVLLDSVSCLRTKSIQLKPAYREKLQGVVTLFEEMCQESTPTEKLKKAFLALRELGNKFVSFGSNSMGHGAFGASADELSDYLVVMLCNIDMKLLLQIYISAQMMRDLMAEYLETGPYGFSVMQLIISLHFLQERIVMQRGLILNQQEYSVMC